MRKAAADHKPLLKKWRFWGGSFRRPLSCRSFVSGVTFSTIFSARVALIMHSPWDRNSYPLSGNDDVKSVQLCTHTYGLRTTA
jgi:hypothetical protein